MEGEEYRAHNGSNGIGYEYEHAAPTNGEAMAVQDYIDDLTQLGHQTNGEVQTYAETMEVQAEMLDGSGDSLQNEFEQNAEFQGDGAITEVDALAEQMQNVEVSEPAQCRVKVVVTFSPVLFLGEDLYQQKRIRSMIYRYDDSYFMPLDIEDLSLDMIVLVVDDDGVDFQRAIVSEIKRIGISVDGLDHFGIKAVTTVYECPEEIQEEKPAVRKYSLKAPPKKEPLLRGQRLNLICNPSDKDYVEAIIAE